MDKKAQAGVGYLFTVFVGIVVGVALLTGSITGSIGEMTNTVELDNVTIGTPVNDTTTYLDYRSISDVVITLTNGTVLGSGNYTVTNNAIDPSDGQIAVGILPNITSANWQDTACNISGTAQRQGYVAEGGTRAIAGLIIIFCCMAIAVFAIPDLRNGVLDLFKK